MKNSKPFQFDPKYLLLVGLGVILFFPFLLTCKALFPGFDFSNTGQIGDTIGGITAPFLSLIGSILVYLALKAQIDANKIIQQQISEDKIAKNDELQSQNLALLYQYTQKTIQNFEINITEENLTGTKEKSNYRIIGNDAFAHIWSTFGKIEFGPNKYQEYNSLLKLMISLRAKINESTATNKLVIAELLDYQFKEIIMSGLHEHAKAENSYESYFQKKYGELDNGNPTLSAIRKSIISYQKLMI